MNAVPAPDLLALRRTAHSLEITASLRHTARELWPHLLEKDLLLRKAGMAAADYHFSTDAQGRTHTQVTSTLMGMLPEAYEELPQEWLPPHYSAVERVYRQGPLRYFAAEWHSRDQDGGGCELRLTLRWLPRLPLLPLRPMMRRMATRLMALHRDSDAHVRGDWGAQTFFADPAAQREKIQRLQDAWAQLMPDSEIPARLAEYIYTAPDKLLVRLRPFEAADYYRLPRLEVLRFCLHATRAGFLDMQWELLCPVCRGSNAQVSHLGQINGAAHCDACNIEYDANFDRNVEVTFRPLKRWREVSVEVFCPLSPGGLPHIFAQFNLEGGQQRYLDLNLPEGDYRLHSGDTDWKLHSRQQGAASLRLELGGAAAEHTVAAALQLDIHNPGEQRESVKIEHLGHSEQVASAALVSSLQEFRDLFAAEVLRPDVRLGISNLVFLFSDLKDSTQLYEQYGDAEAFNLVQTHFDIMREIIRTHDGAIVKTIGDAVMAVFNSAETGLDAALAMLRAFAGHNRDLPAHKHIIIKLGLHQGPSIALNLNDKLDYFGATVNRAARVQGQSSGGDLVISAELHDDPGIQARLAAGQLAVSDFSAQLKGIAGARQLYRIRETP